MEEFFVGVDIGSLTAKVVLVDVQGKALAGHWPAPATVAGMWRSG